MFHNSLLGSKSTGAYEGQRKCSIWWRNMKEQPTFDAHTEHKQYTFEAKIFIQLYKNSEKYLDH